MASPQHVLAMRREKAPRPLGLTGMAVFGFLNLVTRGKDGEDGSSVSVSSRRSSRSHYRRYPNARTKSNYQPPPITPSLAKRKRPLTPTPSNRESLNLHGQEQSLLFNLPPAVLDLIIEYVIGDRLVHIVRLNDGLGHTSCQIGVPNCHEQCQEKQCRGLKLPTGRHIKPHRTHENFIPLLQTCRKIYTSAIPILYSTTIFDFDSMESLVKLSTTTLPNRFDSIRRLSLDFRFNTSKQFTEGTPSNDWARWERLWRIIGSMKSLDKLWVRIEWHKEDVGLVKERIWLDELIQVKRLSIFEVELAPLKSHEKAVDEGFRRVHGEWEFIVRRRAE